MKARRPWALLPLVLFTALPLAAGLVYAFCYSFGLTGALSKGFTTQHWAELLSDSSVGRSFALSAATALVSVLVAAFAGMLLALRYRTLFQRGLLSYLVYLPLAFPAMVVAFIIFQLFSGAGLLARLLFQAGLLSNPAAFPALTNDRWGVGILIAQVFLSLPFFVLLYSARIVQERVPEYMALAATLGAARRQALRRVAIPLLLRRTLPNILIYFLFIFGSYEIPVLLGRSDPEMISVLAVRKLQKFNLNDIPQGYALALLYTAATVTLLFLVFKIKRDETA